MRELVVIRQRPEWLAVKVEEISQHVYADRRCEAEDDERRESHALPEPEKTIKRCQYQARIEHVFIPRAIGQPDEQERFSRKSNDGESIEFELSETAVSDRSNRCVCHSSHPPMVRSIVIRVRAYQKQSRRAGP